MENSLYIGLSKQVVLRENMNIIANNVANVNTPGFRAQNMVFNDFIEDPRYMKEDIAMVIDYGQYQMTDPGSLSTTGNSLDIALVGPGFLGVQALGGDTQFTRAGNLGITPEGTLVTARGFPVLSQGGGEITIPQNAGPVTIDQNGVISTQQGQVDQLMIMEFDNPQDLDPAGNGLYRTDAEGNEAESTRVKQGMLESSNVQAVIEMTRMIEVLRDYQSVQNLMRSEHDRLRNAGQRLARTTA
ncbi:MAG: flagellar basal-body rod protein FlgF [Pseudomonadota bacterium]